MEALNIGKGMRSKREVKTTKFARIWTGQSRFIDMQNNTNKDITVTVSDSDICGKQWAVPSAKKSVILTVCVANQKAGFGSFLPTCGTNHRKNRV